MSCKKKLSILGVTGSIGQSTVDIVRSAPDRFDVCTVTAYENVEKLAEIAHSLGAGTAVIGHCGHELRLRSLLQGSGIAVLSGEAALEKAVGPDTDITVSAITGVAGLKPLMNALRHSKVVAIANKEPLVAAGDLVMAQAQKYNTQILPIDSEHNAIFQVFDVAQGHGVKRILLTASGGPFLNWQEEDIRAATPEQAIAHPNWDMGAKISVDSATMMNKALEVIEAHILFDLPAEKINVLIHPQSVVHSMVEYNDGSVLSQMGASDMRTPIAYALGWPERMHTPGKVLDFSHPLKLDFEPADFDRFPALRLAYECLEKGPMACLVFNAANEIAVDAFLRKEISFPAILEIIVVALDNMPGITLQDIDSVAKADRAVRQLTSDYIDREYLKTKNNKEAV